MSDSIKKIEDLSLNAWPSHQMQVYDGWILRFSYFYTHRTNCAEQIGLSTLPISEKIPFCENTYRRWGTPCIFKISPIGDPDLDRELSLRGYRIEHETNVMTASLDVLSPAPALPPGFEFQLTDRVDAAWIDTLFRLKEGAPAIHRKIVPHMYAAIPMDEIVLRVCHGGQSVGIGLGILDRDMVGVYAIHVHSAFRRKGIARFIVASILNEARSRGASAAYLQVVSDNGPAKSLYRKLSFEESYRYYFRVK